MQSDKYRYQSPPQAITKPFSEIPTGVSDTSEKFTRNLNFESKSQSRTDFFQMRWQSKYVTFDTSVLFHRIKKIDFFFNHHSQNISKSVLGIMPMQDKKK